jgi:hypothetical protein
MKKQFLLPALLVLSIALHLHRTKQNSRRAWLGMMEARQIGPAVMGGRISAIDVVTKDPRIIYIGTAGGGIWKSTTGGTLFKSYLTNTTSPLVRLPSIKQNRISSGRVR